MSLFEKPSGPKYHSRTIGVDISDYDEDRLVIEGELIDQRYAKYYLATGEEKAPGKLHHMLVHLLVHKSTLAIEDVKVGMPAFPNEECPQASDSLDSLKGVVITKGFTSKIRSLTGRGKGCTHLVELLAAMAPAIIQGVISYRANEFPRLKAELIKDMIHKFMNSCYCWRPGSVLVGLLQERVRKSEQSPSSTEERTGDRTR